MKIGQRSTLEVLYKEMKFRQLVVLSVRFLQPAVRDALSSSEGGGGGGGGIAFLMPLTPNSAVRRVLVFNNLCKGSRRLNDLISVFKNL